VASRNKNKRESRLSFKIYLKQFVILYDYSSAYGIFFGLNKRFSKAFKRNKVKRIFRERFRQEVKPILEECGIKSFSICLVSKKSCRLESFEEVSNDIRKGLAKLVEKLILYNK
jgi:ribonuclease P protein component